MFYITNYSPHEMYFSGQLPLFDCCSVPVCIPLLSRLCRALRHAGRAAAAAEIWDLRAERRRHRQFMVAAGMSRRRLRIRPLLFS